MSFYDYYHDIIMLLKYVEIFPEKYPGKFRKFSGQFFRLTTLFAGRSTQGSIREGTRRNIVRIVQSVQERITDGTANHLPAKVH